MTDNHCEICGMKEEWLNMLDDKFGLKAVWLFDSDTQDLNDAEIVTACRECLVNYSAYKLTLINETGATRTGWIIDDHKVHNGFFNVELTAKQKMAMVAY